MVVVEKNASGIATVVLDNPQRHNALNGQMFQQLADVWHRLEHDDDVRAVVLTGAGSDAFSSGADLSEALHTQAGIDDLIDRALLKTALFTKPLIAAINGYCLAGGMELMLAADIRIVGRTAQLGFPEVRWGVLPSGGGAMKLLDQLPHAYAMDLLLTARLISGEEAARMGLVTVAVDPSEVLPLAVERAQTIVRNSPVAVQMTKKAALEHRAVGYAAREDAERALVTKVRDSGQQDEGIAAFLARRAPSYASSSDGEG